MPKNFSASNVQLSSKYCFVKRMFIRTLYVIFHYIALALIFPTRLYTANSKLIEKLGDDLKEVVIHISRV